MYINYAPLVHYRWVNNNDIVTRVPPTWWGYCHGGREMYIDCKGRVRNIDGCDVSSTGFGASSAA